MGYGLKYYMNFKNRGTEDLLLVKIYDKIGSSVDNPYNIHNIGIVIDDMLNMTFFWNPLPVNVDSVIIGYSSDGGTSWTEITTGTASPQTITIPQGTYVYRVKLHFTDSSETTYNLFELAPQAQELLPADEALEESVIDNDEEKFKQIRAKQMVLRFVSNANINLSTFCFDPVEDDRYYVTVETITEGRFIFKGYLLPDDAQEPYLSPGNIVELKATDRLGTLKDVALTKDDGSNPKGIFRIIDYLSWALKKTGLSLPINCVHNLRSEESVVSTSFSFVSATKTINFAIQYSWFFSVGKTIRFTGSQSNNRTFTVATVGSGNITVNEAVTDEINLGSAWINCIDVYWHFYKDQYLDAKTFEDEPAVSSLDCYTVLEKILGEDAFITEEKGEWWIKRIDEFDFNDDIVFRYDANGNYILKSSGVNVIKQISKNDSSQFINKATTVSPVRAMKYVKETFEYEYPKEIPCNNNFIRGAANPSLDGSFHDVDGDGSTKSYKAFNLDCWTMKKGFDGSGVPDSQAYIRRIYNNVNYEVERYLVIKPSANPADINGGSFYGEQYLESEPIPINAQDKFTFSYDVRTASNFSGGQDRFLGRIILHGNDNSWWVLDYETLLDSTTPLKWWDSLNRTIYSAFGLVRFSATDITETDWNTFNIDAPPCPISGDIYIWLTQFHQIHSSSDDIDIFYKNISFDYNPLINGSYKKYTGQSNKVSNALNFQSNRQAQLYISDSPKKLFKGSLLLYKSNAYELSNRFYNAAVFPDGPPNYDYMHPYSYLISFSVWNQYNRLFRIFRASLLGLDAASTDADLRCNTPGLIHKFRIADSSPHNNNKYFQLLSYVKNWKGQLWTATLKEIYDVDKGKKYDDAWEFKYEEE